MWRHSEKAPAMNEGTDPPWTVSLPAPCSWTPSFQSARNKCLLWVFATVAQADSDAILTEWKLFVLDKLTYFNSGEKINNAKIKRERTQIASFV